MNVEALLGAGGLLYPGGYIDSAVARLTGPIHTFSVVWYGHAPWHVECLLAAYGVTLYGQRFGMHINEYRETEKMLVFDTRQQQAMYASWLLLRAGIDIINGQMHRDGQVQPGPLPRRQWQPGRSQNFFWFLLPGILPAYRAMTMKAKRKQRR